MKPEDRAIAPQLPSGRAAVVMRMTSAVALGLAVAAAIGLVVLRIVHCFKPNLLRWSVKSAFPLILTGIAFAALQFVLQRTRPQILLGLMVALAFMLWGAEQFVSNQVVASFMDDIVVLLFVLDLSIVIYAHLKPGAHSVGNELPFDEPGE
jgi:peptidoglycan/LPS O-acetylase OafA/YrhL